MAMAPLVLIANPGSSSRKYALYAGKHCRGKLQFEHSGEGIDCIFIQGDVQEQIPVSIQDITKVTKLVMPMFIDKGLLSDREVLAAIGIRVVAPGSYFLEDHIVDNDFFEQIRASKAHAPLHIKASLLELESLQKEFPDTRLIGVSDSAFHANKPDYAWNYGLPLDDADKFEIKRFGYHGLSIASIVHTLEQSGKLPKKLIVCHVGSGVSVTALLSGRSIDTTMGYSPLDGLVMATRSGSVDPTAIQSLKQHLGLNDKQMQTYLNKASGLLGLSGQSPDVRNLLRAEAEGNHRARLALNTYVYGLQKAIGQMAASLDGADVLVFTGAVGERSAPIREHVVKRLNYLDFLVDGPANTACELPSRLVCVSRLARSKPIYVVPTDESAEIARHVVRLI